MPFFRSSHIPPYSIPARALPSRKKNVSHVKTSTERIPESSIRYVPYLPPNLVSETVRFLQSPTKFRGLLNLLYSPTNSKDDMESRAEFQKLKEIYDLKRQIITRLYGVHEAEMARNTWNAISSLPRDLYEEAIQSSTTNISDRLNGNVEEVILSKSNETHSEASFPSKLKFHTMYRNQLMERELSEYELQKVQVFQNLMFLRYPHCETKRLKPHMFWISEKQAVSRQREAARGKAKRSRYE